MPFNTTLVITFRQSLEELTLMHIEGIHAYERTREVLTQYKRNQVSLIGNGFLKLLNQLIEFNYLLKLHILNCEVYRDLLDEGITIDESLILQLEDLINTSQKMSKQLEDFQINLNELTSRENQQHVGFAF